MTTTTQAPNETADDQSRRRTVTYWVDERDGKFPLPWWKLLPLVLLIGAAVIAILTLIMIPIYERQVIANAQDELRAAGIDPTSLAFEASYRDLDISGVLPAGVSAADVEAAVENADGLRDLDLDLTTASPAVVDDEEEPEPAPVETAATEVTVTVTVDGVVVTGEVPSEEHRALLIAEATARFGAGNVTDELDVRGLEPTTSGADDRVRALATLLGQLPDGATGSVSLTDTSFTSEWSVVSDDDRAAIEALVRSAGAAFGDDGAASTSIDVETSPVAEQIEELQAEFDALEVEIRENVTFATNSDVLDATATETLDKVVALMDTYTEPVVEISGHTDDIGDDQFNLELSTARAAAVRQYLIDAGVDADRIESVGRGETDPIDTNDTPEGRANNRRVELVALETFAE